MLSTKKLCLIAGAAALMIAGPASAQVNFQGTSYGCFGWDCTPSGSSTASSVFGTDILDYTGEAFSGTTSGGALDLTFGYFDWRSFSGVQLLAQPFTLFLNFVSPTGISPDPIYGGGALGLVRVQGSFWSDPFSIGAVFFHPNERTYSFSGPDSPGQFTLTLNDTYLNVTGQSYIRGDITGAGAGQGTVTPEPITMLLMGSGLAGIAAARRRRKLIDV
jgi:hypothetical protein